jgi:hypothetical protein
MFAIKRNYFRELRRRKENKRKLKDFSVNYFLMKYGTVLPSIFYSYRVGNNNIFHLLIEFHISLSVINLENLYSFSFCTVNNIKIVNEETENSWQTLIFNYFK